MISTRQSAADTMCRSGGCWKSPPRLATSLDRRCTQGVPLANSGSNICQSKIIDLLLICMVAVLGVFALPSAKADDELDRMIQNMHPQPVASPSQHGTTNIQRMKGVQDQITQIEQALAGSSTSSLSSWQRAQLTLTKYKLEVQNFFTAIPRWLFPPSLIEDSTNAVLAPVEQSLLPDTEPSPLPDPTQ